MHAYVQVHPVARDSYVKSVLEFNLPEDQYLKIVRHLYGPLESGDPRFHKYNLFLTETSKVSQSAP